MPLTHSRRDCIDSMRHINEENQPRKTAQCVLRDCSSLSVIVRPRPSDASGRNRIYTELFLIKPIVSTDYTVESQGSWSEDSAWLGLGAAKIFSRTSIFSMP